MKIQAFEKLRIFSCVLVILVHVSAQITSSADVYDASFAFGYFCNILAFSGVTMFVMMSGALSLREGKEVSVKETLLKRFVRFFLLYMLWKGIFIVFDLLRTGEILNTPDLKETIRLAAIKWIGGNAYYHLWYLPMIAFLSLLVPMIYKGVQDKNVCRLFLVPFILLCLFIPTAFFFEFPFKYLILDFLKQCREEYFPGYLGYFILGHFLYKWKDDINNNKRIVLYIAGIIALVIATYFGVIRSQSSGNAFEGYSSPFSFTNMLTSSALFMLFVSGKESEKENNFLKTISNLTLGIYLVHPMILELLKDNGLLIIEKNVYLLTPVYVLVLFVISSIISFILSKLPVRVS